MAKIRNLSESAYQLNFLSSGENFDKYYQKFHSSDLGLLYQSIRWQTLSKALRRKLKVRRTGCPAIFDLQGKLALLLLKSYTQSSDRDLIARLNSDYKFQFFCGLCFGPEDELKDSKIVSRIRSELAQVLDIHEFQSILMKHWQAYMEGLDIFLTGATCYETSLRYPTNVKLLWECFEWTYGQMKTLNKVRKGRMPRNKYPEQKDTYLHYQRSKKDPHKHTERRIKSLLYLLEKLLGQLEEILETLPEAIKAPGRLWDRKRLIEKIYSQQQQWFISQESPDDLIVSIDKDYIRPILGGKEIKRVEFGAKVNMIQINGINFIEHISFDSFHEGIRLKQCIFQVQSLTHRKCKALGADAIYATNPNRSYCRAEKIQTNFIPKGKPSKHAKAQKQLRTILSKERATRMEGSFGTHKQHYGLHKIRARTDKNEILWIVFGVHRANAVAIARRIKKALQKPPWNSAEKAA